MICRQFLIFTFIFSFLSIFQLSQAFCSSPSVEFDHIEENTVFFKTANGTTPPKPLKTGLFDLKYLGSLSSPESEPYFVFTGKPCAEKPCTEKPCATCMEEKAVYILKPQAEKPVGFVYPGKILDPKNKALLHEARAFFGKCMNHKRDVYVVFQRERIDRRRGLQPSVLVVEPAKEHLHEKLIERRPLPQIKVAEKAVKRKICQEIDVRKREMHMKVNLHPKQPGDPNDDDDDDDRADADEDSNISAPSIDTPILPAKLIHEVSAKP
jgi:hypothetical protein